MDNIYVNTEYIGDGVYCGFDGYQVWVWTSNGMTQSEKIALEPDVLVSLVKYNTRMQTERLKRAVAK